MKEIEFMKSFQIPVDLSRSQLKEREVDLWKQYHMGDKAVVPYLLKSLDPVIQSNVNKFTGAPLPRPALESEARRLTVKSFDTYDPNKGAALNTHVTNHLKHLQRYVLQYQNVGKIPEHRGIAISRFQNIKSNLEDELNRPPTTYEIADALAWSPKEVERMNAELRQDLSIGTGKEDTSSFFDAGFHSKNKALEIARLIYHTAPNKTKKIMEYTFGWGGNPQLTTAEIADRLNMPESQVRKIRSQIAVDVENHMEYF